MVCHENYHFAYSFLTSYSDSRECLWGCCVGEGKKQMPESFFQLVESHLSRAQVKLFWTCCDSMLNWCGFSSLEMIISPLEGLFSTRKKKVLEISTLLGCGKVLSCMAYDGSGKVEKEMNENYMMTMLLFLHLIIHFTTGKLRSSSSSLRIISLPTRRSAAQERRKLTTWKSH